MVIIDSQSNVAKNIGGMMQLGTDNTKFPRKSVYVGAIILIVIFLIGLKSCISSSPVRFDGVPSQVSLEPSTPIIVELVNNLNVERRVRKLVCLEQGSVDYAIVELFPRGGTSPYTYLIENSLSEIEGPFTLANGDKFITLVVNGGEMVFVKIWSTNSDEPDWVGTIFIATRDAYCDDLNHLNTAILTNTPTATTTPTFTPIYTATYTLTPTFTPTYTSTSTLTLTPTLTFTPTQTPTYTPTSTLTLTPTPTFTYTPTYTSTPSSKWQCSDGIDNDGDGFTDLNDPQCKSSNDNNEYR